MDVTRAEYEEFFRLHAVTTQATKRLEELKAKIKPAIVAGAASPKDLPFRLVIRTRVDVQRDYRTPLYTALKKLLRTTVKADAELERIESEFPVRTIESLHVELNPDPAAFKHK